MIDELNMTHNGRCITTNLFRVAVALGLVLGRVAHAGGEQMMALHAIPVKADARWTEPADKRLTLGLTIVVKINKLESDKFDADVQDPTSPNYHHWLPRGKAGAEEYRRRFWPLPAKIEALREWLSNQGFEILEPFPAGLRVSGTVATVEKAFATTIVKSPDGYYYANKTQPQIPASFAAVVERIEGLDNIWGGVHSPHNVSRNLAPMVLAPRFGSST